MDTTATPHADERIAGKAITLASWLGDQVPMPDEVRARLVALEGAQPSLHEMRIALGVRLDLSAVWYAYEALAPDFAQPQFDAQLAAIVDAMYRAIAGPCTVHVRLGAAGEA